MLKALKPNSAAVPVTPLLPGIYGLQNKAGETYVSLATDEESIACFPAEDLRKTGVKLVRMYHHIHIEYLLTTTQWELSPLGNGFTIRLYGTDKYCTLQEGTGDRCLITLSNIPAAWRIEPVESPVNAREGYVR